MSLEAYRNYVEQNRNVGYSVIYEPIPTVSAIHKWVGAQYTEKNIYCIPNDMDRILKYGKEGVTYLGEMDKRLFKWTGGCIWNGFLYGFPRTSNDLLKMSLKTEKIEYVSVGKGYPQEHHYGGICSKRGVIYQPPRDSDHILVWDLKEEKTRRIYLQKNKMSRYSGSILMPNGYAYFLPEKGEKVIMLSTDTEEWSYIGEELDAMVFDAKIAVDGNIYGYSAYCEGILKIDTKSDHTEMIHKEISPGAYGTKLGVNGHLYSIPGDGKYIWDYDPITDSLNYIYEFKEDKKAKYAGGVSKENGDIYAVPAKEERLMKLSADCSYLKIPGHIFSEFFVDFY